MAKTIRKLNKCKSCGGKFSHPDIYSGRCEDCFSADCAHNDSVNKRPRKTSNGRGIKCHYSNGKSVSGNQSEICMNPRILQDGTAW